MSGQLIDMSATMRSMWLHEQLDPGSVVNHLGHAFRRREYTDVDAIEAAAQSVVDRHDALRGSVQVIDGEPRLVISDHVEVNLDRVSVEGWSRTRLEEFASEWLIGPYDLVNGPLVRFAVLSAGPADHILLLGAHHLVSDMWSISMMGGQIGEAYVRLTAGGNPRRSQPRSTLGAHVAAERDFLASVTGAQQLDFWTEQLAGLDEPLAIPADRPRTLDVDHRGGLRSFDLAPASAAALRTVATTLGTTPFNVLLTAFSVVLHRQTGHSDIAVATIKAGRTARNARVQGCFVNPIILRNHIDGTSSFASTVGGVAHVVGDAFDNDSYPLQELIERLSRSRSSGNRPFSNVGFLWQKTTRAFDRSASAATAAGRAGVPGDFGGLEVETEFFGVRTSPYELAVLVAEVDDDITVSIEYLLGLFDAATIDRFADQLRTVLDAALANPDTPVGQLPMLSDDELAQLRSDEVLSPSKVDQTVTAHGLFEDAVRRTPDKMAVQCRNRSLSYEELNRAADIVAATLRARGVARGNLVGIYLERSVDMIAAVLGVLKTGAAYVPLDPRYPVERLRLIIDDSEMSTVLTEATLHRDVEGAVDDIVLVDELDMTATSGASHGSEASVPQNDSSGDDLAYVIYTSGSTGRPKGVAVEHRNVVNLVAGLSERPGLTADDVVLSQASLSFDMSVAEIFPPLAVGASVVFATHEDAVDVAALDRLIVESHATIFEATPTTFRLLVDSGWEGGVNLTVWCGGEALPPGLAEALRERVADLWNMYGPTEATVWASTLHVDDRSDADMPSVPLGEALAGVGLYVLDELHQEVPVGVVGELYIGGAGVARGYINNPALSEARFVPDVVHPETGRPMYATGDLVSRDANGALVFRGRADHQVKIRGHRIELGEIEATLDRHPDVMASVALVHEFADDDTRIVAYVTSPQDVAAPTPAELREFAGRTLPNYMIPAVVMAVDQFPRTQNEKIDRNRLPAPHLADAVSALSDPALPGLETVVAQVWSEVLGLPEVGRRDDFFALGGHSLLATKIASRLRVQTNRDVEIRTVFKNPTVAGLARAIESCDVVPLRDPRAFGDPAVFPLTYSQERMWFLQQLNPSTLAYNLAGAARLSGPLDVDALRKSLDIVVARHDSMRTVFESQDGVPVQRVVPAFSVELSVVDCSDADSSLRWNEIETEMIDGARQTFVLDQLPLVCFKLFRASEREHGLLVVMHHIISDQWSIGIMLTELSECYAALLEDRAPELEPVSIQLGEYALWHRELVEDQRLDNDLEYWRRQLDGIAHLDLPTDRPRPPVQSGQGQTIDMSVPPRVVSLLDGLCRNERVTPFMAMLAAFQVLLARYTGQRDITVGTAIANRNWLESEGMIGSLVNSLVLRSDIDGDLSFRDVLHDVKATSLDAFAHQDMPFARLVGELQPERDRSRSPLFQVFFNVQSAPFETPSLSGIATELIHLERGAAQFDLSLSVNTVEQTASLEFSSDLFDHERMKRLFDHYWTLLESVLVEPERPVGDATMLTQVEQTDMSRSSLGHQNDGDLSAPVHQLFEATTAASPESIAVRDDTELVTYAELNGRANQLARHLRSEGITSGQIVGIMAKPSIDMVTAVLAVSKTGAAYVPLDPSYPQGRLDYMTSDAETEVVITHEALADRVTTARHIVLDQVDTAGLDANNLDVEVAGDDLAYVIYTSGSTGQPKGVLVEHRMLMHYLVGARRRPGMTADDVVLALTTLSFDPSIHELLLPLVVGGEVVIVTREVAVNASALQTKLTESGATVMQATPTTWRMLIEDGWTGTPGLTVLCGGEAMTPDLAVQLCARADSVWNQYGPTETTVWATFHEVDAERDGTAEGSVSIGVPIDNAIALVVDHRMQPMPIGVPGELYLGGPGVTRGYLNQPELTARAFVPNPLYAEHNERFYRTGDLVVRNSDGTMTFIGRVDHQVKLRGHRIEPGEIEARIDTHPAVTRSVVVVREFAPGDERLVAYLTTAPGHTPMTTRELRAHTKSTLPDYMIPSVAIILDEFPRTPSNKIDRKLLPAPTGSFATSGSNVEPPRSGTEAAIALIWSEVLVTADIGRHDDFFQLGGHSLLAIRMFARLEEELGRKLPLSALFEGSTVAELAELFESGTWRSRWTSLVPIKPEGHKTPFFYVSPFLVTVLSMSHLGHHLGQSQPFYGLQPQGMESDYPIHDSIEDMAAHYIEEMRDVQPVGPYFIGGHCSGSWVAFEMARQLQTAGDEVALLVLVDFGPPNVDRSRPPLVPYVWERLRYYASDGRLRQAIRWQFGIMREKSLIRRVGGERARQSAEVRSRHAAAHDRYQPSPIEGDVLLIRSEETDGFADRDWHLKWQEWISGTVRVAVVPGTHAGLVEYTNAAEWAEVIRAGIDGVADRRTEVAATARS